MCVYKVGYYFLCPGKPGHKTVTLRSRETVGCGNNFFEAARSYEEKTLVDRLAKHADEESDENDKASDHSSNMPPYTQAVRHWISTRTTATLRHRIQKFDFQTQVNELAKAGVKPCSCASRKAWNYYSNVKIKYCEKCSGKLELWEVEPPVREDYPWDCSKPSEWPDSRDLTAIKEPDFVRTSSTQYYCGGDPDVARPLKFAAESPPVEGPSRGASPERLRGKRSTNRPSFDACSEDGHGHGPSHRFTNREQEPNRPSFESCSDEGHEGLPARIRHASRPLIQDLLSSNAERSGHDRHAPESAASEVSGYSESGVSSQDTATTISATRLGYVDRLRHQHTRGLYDAYPEDGPSVASSGVSSAERSDAAVLDDRSQAPSHGSSAASRARRGSSHASDLSQWHPNSPRGGGGQQRGNNRQTAFYDPFYRQPEPPQSSRGHHRRR